MKRAFSFATSIRIHQAPVAYFSVEPPVPKPFACPASRRTAMKLLGGGAIVSLGSSLSAVATAASRPVLSLADSRITIAFDAALRTRIGLVGRAHALTDFSASEGLRLADDSIVDRFLFTGRDEKPAVGKNGSGTVHTVTGLSDRGIEKTVTVTLLDRAPGFALVRVGYRNTGSTALAIKGWHNGAHVVRARGGGDRSAWTFAGASHADRRDWVQPVIAGFDQRNFMGMNASDYGGGTPVATVWRRDAGLAVGHVEMVPQQVALPVTQRGDGVRLAIEGEWSGELAPGVAIVTPETFVAVHRGDCFVPLAQYGKIMAERGLTPGEPCRGCYEPIWCAWGYERNFTTAQIIQTLPKARALGLTWAVIDDGWQTAEGDWYLDPTKFPGGEKDMKALVRKIREAGLKPKLWIAPLAVDPGTDLLRRDTDMLLLDKDGAVQDVTWWNAFYLCPAYPKTIENSLALVRKIIGEWGFEGLKIDGQHLNGVAPCYNPAHGHTRPEESIEGLQQYWKTLYDAALALNPDAVIELCPCGTSYAFHNMIGHNQSVASDPESSWQIRHKGKVIHAVAGGRAAYSGDHVELSDGGDDFASTVGIGGVPSTKFTWPIDPKPKDSFLLTPEREKIWAKWIALYKQLMLPTGQYRGDLYDIGFDRPEAHAIAKDNVLYYTFYAPDFAGEVELRGLAPGRYAVRDLWDDRVIATIDSAKPRVQVGFKRFLMLAATPA
jgi:alpha-galactosidase